MAGRKRIAVLFHEREAQLDHGRYLVDQLAPFWREDGHEVVYLFGTGRFVPADLVFVHVDLSVVPDRYLEFAARYPVAVNGRIRDIRKSRTSRIQVRPGDGWTGPVLVKSDHNYGGESERLFEPSLLERHPRLDRLRRRLLRTAGLPQIASLRDYRIFERVEDVPALWFRRRDVVVERFVPELEDGLYHFRMYQFLGDRVRCTRLGSPQPVFLPDESTRVESVEPHPEAAAWREELAVDYGKFDYVVHEGRPILLDANKTTGAWLRVETSEEERRHHARGLYAYL